MAALLLTLLHAFEPHAVSASYFGLAFFCVMTAAFASVPLVRGA